MSARPAGVACASCHALAARVERLEAVEGDLVVRVQALVARLAAVERQTGLSRERDDEAALVALVAAFDQAERATTTRIDYFTAADVRELARLDRELRQALVQAADTTTKAIGRLFGRLADRDVARPPHTRRGARWHPGLARRGDATPRTRGRARAQVSTEAGRAAARAAQADDSAQPRRRQ